MAKPLFQDIVPPERRSIKRIPVPERRTERPAEEPEMAIRPAPRPPAVQGGGNFFKILLTLLAVAAIAGGAFVIASRSTGARVTVTPHQEAVSVDSQFSASSNPQAEGLQYQTVTISKEGKMPVPANGEEPAEIKATGTIVVYNDYSSEPQILVATTRFESSQGLIFRTPQSVTIPGKTVVSGKSVPGSLEVKVVADKPGPDYNVGLADFTIPGFKGDPRYSKFYGRSKTPIQGGFSGMRPKIDESKVAVSREKIKTELEANLVRQAEKDIPEGFVMPSKAYYIEYEQLPSAVASSGGAEIGVRATFHGIIFKKADLAGEIAKKTEARAGGTAVSDIRGFGNLVFAAKAATSSQPWLSSSLAFSLRGTTTLISAVDVEKLKSELAGKPRKSLSALLAGYPSVARAEVTIKPFWNRFFPANKDEIEIILKDGQVSP